MCLLVFSLFLAGCSQTATVTSISLTSSNDRAERVHHYYSDGTTQTLTVQNGQDVTADELYAKYKKCTAKASPTTNFCRNTWC